MSYKQLIYGLFFILLMPITYGANITVCASGCSYTTISAAITNAAADDTIIISAGTYTEAGLTIGKNLTITGAGSGTDINNSTIIQAHETKGLATDRVFKIETTATDVTIEKITVRYGKIDAADDHGGGIANYGVLNLKNCTVTDNETSQSNGGGVFNDGILTMTNCTVANNKANVLDLDLANKTLTEGKGGGVQAGGNSTETTINNSTIYGNYAENISGGLRNGGGNNVSIKNTIIIGNTEKIGDNSDCGGGTITSNGNNLVGDDCPNNGTGDNIVSSANINTVIDTTLNADGTYHLKRNTTTPDFTNPAVHKGSGCASIDQVGTDRTNRGIACDIGAYELPVPINPTPLTTTPAETEIFLTWLDNNNLGNDHDETNFRIERSLDNSDWSNPTTATVGQNIEEYNDTSLTCNTTYYYRVYAYNTYGDSHYAEINDTTSACGSPPTAPSNLITTVASQTQINLDWTDSTNEDGFKIERSLDETAWTQITTVVADTVNHNDAGLTCGTTYYYRVHAYNSAGGNSGYTTDNATTDSCSQNFTVTTAKSGTGSGTVTPTNSYPSGSTVTLSATANSDSTFSGWSSGCSNSFAINADINCTATFTITPVVTPPPPIVTPPTPPLPQTRNLTIKFSGFGSGTVKSSPNGINCNTKDEEECKYTFDTATKIKLSYVADSGSEFKYWNGVIDCNDGKIFIIKNTSCTAHFDLLPTDLTVQFAGEGTVTSNPSGINCNQNCTKTFAGNSKITLTPEPKLGWLFDSWEGDCDSEGQVTLDAKKQCKAIFVVGEPLKLYVLKTGKGYVSSNPPGIDCGEDCVEEYANGLTIALTAIPDEGWEFEGWRGHCEAEAIMTESDKYCRAVFILPEISLEVVPETIPDTIEPIEPEAALAKLTVVKTGEGTVTGEGIQCGDVCQQDYVIGSQLNLTATPSEGWEFWGWKGDCDINGNVVLDEAKTCQALFGQAGMPLHLTVVKYGNGRITSQPDGIDCGVDCKKAEHEFIGGKQVTLTATPDSGWQLEGWRGHCDDVGNVTILDDYRTCQAFFVADPNFIPIYGETITETVHGGQVTSTVLDFADGSSKLQLTATPESEDYALVGWENCAGNTQTIVVTDGTDCQPIFALDKDKDGTADMVENAAPNNGDGNNDGIPDSQQNNVTSLPTASEQYLTTEVENDCPVNNVQLDSGTTTFALGCEQTTVTTYNHGISKITNTDNQDISYAIVTIQDQPVATETFVLTVDSSGKSIHINSYLSGQVHLSSSNYIVRETDQTAKITVMRNNGCDGRLTVDYTTQSATATPNVDYLLKHGSLTWENNDCSNKSFNITILDDVDKEDIETIQINLLNAETTTPYEAILTIIDDDSLITTSNENLDIITNDESNLAGGKIAVIDAINNQIISLIVGQTKVFNVKDAMVFIKQFPDFQLVSVAGLKAFADDKGELTLLGLNIGETEMTISNQDYSKEVTFKIIVTGESQTDIDSETKPDIKPIEPTAPLVAKCDNHNALAMNSIGQSVNSDSCFISILNNIDQSVKRKLNWHQNIRITSKIFIDIQDIGKIADIILVVKYTDSSDKTVLFNRGNKTWQVWDEQFASLLVAQEHPLLPKIVNVFVFEGSLSVLTGEFTVFVGYQLEDGTIVFNGLEPLNFLVE